MYKTKNIIAYGQALVSALKSFQTLELKANWFERVLLKVLRASYQQRLKHFVDVLPSETSEAILNPGHGPDRTGRTGLDANHLTGEDLEFELDMKDVSDPCA